MRFPLKTMGLAAVLAAGALAVGHLAFAGGDLGQDIENQIEAHSVQNFGIVQGLDASSTTNINQATALADPTNLVTLAKSLKAKTVAVVDGAPNVDMISLWPNDTAPTHLILQRAGQRPVRPAASQNLRRDQPGHRPVRPDELRPNSPNTLGDHPLR